MARNQSVTGSGHRGDRDRAPGEPGPDELGQGVAAGDQRPHPGRVPEHLVERQRDEVDVAIVEVQRVGRSERRCVPQHPPAVRDLRQRVLHPGVVGLGGQREQAGRSREGAQQSVLVESKVGGEDRHVGDRRPGPVRVLADPVDRVVVVGAEHQGSVGAERERLGDQADGTGRVRGEDALVGVRIGTDETQHRLAGLFDHLAGRTGGRVVGVGVAEHPTGEHLQVVSHQRLGIEPGAGVVQVDVAVAVEAREVLLPQTVQVIGRAQPLREPQVIGALTVPVGPLHRPSLAADTARGHPGVAVSTSRQHHQATTLR